MIVTTEILSVACIMNKEGMSYQNPTHMILAINMAKANSQGYIDSSLAIEGLYEFMKIVANEYNTKPEKAPIPRQVNIKTYELLCSSIKNAVEEGCEDWIEFFSFLRDKELDVLYNIAYTFKGMDFVTPTEFLEYLENSIETKYVLPPLEIDENVAKVIKSVGIAYEPRTIKEELAYIALFMNGVAVLQSLPSLELQAVVEYVPILNHVIRTSELL